MRKHAPNVGAWPRRRVLQFLAASGVGGAVFADALVAIAAGSPQVTSKMLDRASWLSGVELSPDERELMLEGVNELLTQFETNRSVLLTNDVPPAVRFDPAMAGPPRARATGDPVSASPVASTRPGSDQDLAFLGAAELGHLIRTRRLSAVELTGVYLDRLERFDPALECVVSLTRDLALRQAEVADRDLAAGNDHGPLHGVPWGAKDLLAVDGYPTTWGATPYRGQRLGDTATVVERLSGAGAVLVAKLTLGALAWGDVWFGGKTRNPWNVEEGSSGSSAGSASAVAAGLVGFALGSETWGSIVSPCTVCGCTGLRPTFGRVSRHGAMALSWTMDKLGPIARSADDCRFVLGAIAGPDPKDPTTVERVFDPTVAPRPDALRVGYLEAAFDEDRTEGVEDEDTRTAMREWMRFDRDTLAKLEALGYELVPIRFPDTYDVSALSFVLTAEAATAFDDLTRSGRDDELVRQVANAWPNVFRQGQQIPAVEYLRANRIRTLLMREVDALFDEVDCYVTPSWVGPSLLATNLTGHPQVVFPNGFVSTDGTPTSISLVGRLFGESDILQVASAYQAATDFHTRRPPVTARPID